MPLTASAEHNRAENSQSALYVVATPIGNLEDITLRALRILNQVNLIAAEDTRHTSKLLRFHTIDTPMLSYHEHNESRRTPELIKKLSDGYSIALVSDAGTPGVSDPGYRLVTTAVANGIQVIPIPGPSAPISALSASGLATDTFVFVGFPSAKNHKREQQLKDMSRENKTVIFYVSPRKIVPFLQEIIAIWGDRDGVLAREMTKKHEEFLRGTLSQILGQLTSRQVIKGECTLLVSGYKIQPFSLSENVLRNLRNELIQPNSRLSEIVKRLSRTYNIPRKELYSAALAIKNTLTTTHHSK